MVYLRDEGGQLLPDNAVPRISISMAGSYYPLPNQPEPEGADWVFSGLTIASDYDIEATATGYQLARERVNLPNIPGAVSSVILFLKPADQNLFPRPPKGHFVLAPKAQKEVQHGVEDLIANKIASARKHLEKALQLAPGNPYVQYVMGMTYLMSRQWEQAKPYLEKSVSIDPTQPLALVALGSLRYRLADDEGAIQVLTKAVGLYPSSWKAEWYLSSAYLRQRKFAESRDHAEQALKIGKGQARLAAIILGEAQANLGERDKAANTFEKFAKDNPTDPNVKDVLHWADLLRHPVRGKAPPKAPSGAVEESAMMSPPWPPPIEAPPREDWAPPDIDASKPFLIEGASCDLQKVLHAAGKNAEGFIQNLQRFSATEEFQTIEIRRSGDVERPVARAFAYLALIDHVSPEYFDVQEVRNDGSPDATLPGRLADMGVPGLALAFHPVIQRDLEWKCEGLGKWSDKPAWIIRFQQRSDRPNVLSAFRTSSHVYALPLKGRAWVSENGGQVLHLETDLMKEIQPIQLKRQHFSIDYEVVSFRTHNMDIWLPSSVDSYIQYQGHFFHHYHHFTNFKLFWVETAQKINDPKEPREQEK